MCDDLLIFAINLDFLIPGTCMNLVKIFENKFYKRTKEKKMGATQGSILFQGVLAPCLGTIV